MLSRLMYTTPPTGDDGLNPIIIFLLVLCAAVIIGCIVWTILINKKNPKHTITIVSADDDLEPETTVVEEITDKPEDASPEE